MKIIFKKQLIHRLNSECKKVLMVNLICATIVRVIHYLNMSEEL